MAQKVFIYDDVSGIAPNGVQYIIRYEVAYKKSSDPDYIPIRPTLALPIEIDALDDDTSYDIRIERVWSIDGKIFTASPVVKTLLTTKTKETEPITFGTVTNNSIQVNWTHGGDIPIPDVYVLQRSTSPSYTNPVQIYKGAGLTFTDTGLTSSTTYYYRVLGEKNGYIGSIWITNSQATT